MSGSHLRRRVSKHSLASLDAIQERATRLIGDLLLTDTLDSLTHRRTVSALSLLYKYYHGLCSEEIKSIIPHKAKLHTYNIFKHPHSFVIKLETNRTKAIANSFFPKTSRDELTFSVHLSGYNYITFILSRPACTGTFNSDQNR